MFALIVLLAVLLAFLALGAIAVYLVFKKIKSDSDKLSAQNAQILKIIAEMKEKKVLEAQVPESPSEPHFNQTDVFVDNGASADSDCESSSSLSVGSDTTTSSGYDSPKEIEIDWDYELYKISVAPIGPVPETQVLLTVTCPLNKQYVKAFTDLDGTIVEIATYAPESSEDDAGFRWQRADCSECLELVEESLKATGCQIPFAEDGDIDWELAYEVEKMEMESDEEAVEIVMEKLLEGVDMDTDKDADEIADKKMNEEPINFIFENLELEYDFYDLNISYQ